MNWSTKGLEKKFDLVLIDAPCSGIGTWSRSPDSRFNFNKKKLVELINIQSELLSKGSTMVAPGGRLAYVTCSILPEEGVDQIEKFKISVNSDFSEIDLINMRKDNLSSTNSFQYPFDNGKKITKNENKKIFEKGFRGSAAKKKDGTGVGLFLARRLAKQIGGELRLLENDSIKNTEKLKNLKKKNIFYLELPIKELHA